MRQRQIQPEETTVGREYISPLQPPTRQEEAAILAATPQETESVEALAASLSREVETHRKAFLRSMGGLSVLCAAGAGMVYSLKHLLGEDWSANTGFPTLLFTVAFCGAAAWLIASALKPLRRRREIASVLANQDDVRSVGALIDSLSLEDGRMHEIAIDGLIRLLPRLKASDATLLTAVQRTRLCHILSLPAEKPLFSDIGYVFRRANEKDIELRVAILAALEQIGDRSALPIVVRLANGKAKTAGQRRIQEAAQACLPALQLLTRLEGDPLTLLRASDAANTAPGTLLRAAQGVAQTPPGELLRPGPPQP